MKAPLSWLKDFVDINISIGELAHLITMAGMEVEELRIIGLPMPSPGSVDAHLSGLEWDREKIVVASISEVLPHPNADRLTLCKLFDGQREHLVLTGAPNLFEFKGIGPLPKALKVAYAKEGAQIYDGHQEGLVLTKLKRATIPAVWSRTRWSARRRNWASRTSTKASCSSTMMPRWGCPWLIPWAMQSWM